MSDQTAKAQLLNAIDQIESAIAALGTAYERLNASYQQAYRGLPTHAIDNLASTVGPDHFNGDIVGRMHAAGLSPLLARAAMRGGEQRNVITDLRGEFAARLHGSGLN